MILQVATSVLAPASDLVNRCIASWRCKATENYGNDITYLENTPEANRGVVGSLQYLLEATEAPIIAFLHSDVEIFEAGWRERVLAEFEDPTVGIVGFGGARQLGHDDIYKTPYQLQQLARFGYASNTRDAEGHGERFAGAWDVATLDGFALVIRRSILETAGGWPLAALKFHNYDNWACCIAAEQGFRTRLVGIDCQHHGGATSTTAEYQDWCLRAYGKTDSQIHEESHLYLYERFRGLLPLRAKGEE